MASAAASPLIDHEARPVNPVDIDELAQSVDNMELGDAAKTAAPVSTSDDTPSRPARIYTRAQILALHNSPLIKVPEGMPDLKDWFGLENELSLNKKDSEISSLNNVNNRRFRRDADDGDAPIRPSFRSSVSQPSQMGNFKHQSFRSNDRDREDGRDGQDRLRNLSEKFDRDRLNLASNLRNKERDPVPHLPSSNGRLAQPPVSPVNARSSDKRENGKKRGGESSEDWRRVDSRRSGNDRSDRADREDRERPRSRARDGRDSSRPRRDTSLSRRDRDDGRRRDRERDRDDYRRDRDDDDDPRRWRDDGRRDERLAARRAERDRVRDKPSDRDNGGDNRWTTVEDRDSRYKRGNNRDRKSGAHEDNHDREKEKEPAWMETYVPPSSGPGILGGKSSDGEMDSIQAWKKGMKEKEQKEQKDKDKSATKNFKGDEAPLNSTPNGSAEAMDEIQLFRMLMKREQEQKPSESLDTLPTSDKAESRPLDADKPKPEASSASAKDSTQPEQPKLLSSLLTSDAASSTPLPSASTQTRDADQGPSMSRFFPRPISQPGNQPDRANNDPGSFNPPQGSRVLALGSAKYSTPQNGSTPFTSTPLQRPSSSNTPPLQPNFMGSVEVQQRPPSGFSPFEEQSRNAFSFEERQSMVELDRRAVLERGDIGQNFDGVPLDSNGGGSGRGSRFAKFFDEKPRNSPTVQSQPFDYASGSRGPPLRHDHGLNEPLRGNDQRTMDDIFNMLNNSSQGVRSHHLNAQGPSSAAAANHLNNLAILEQRAREQLLIQQAQQARAQQPMRSAVEPLYESRMDTRNFVPDGLVPGLRSAPPARGRDGGMYSDPLDDPMVYAAQQQRLPPQQQRGLDALYSGQSNVTLLQQQANARNVQIPQQYRGGPSPLPGQQHIPPAQMQRLPPGLANLGGRPPHEPNQFVGMSGIPSQGLHSAPHGNPSLQQQQAQLNGFPQNGGNLGFGGPQSQMRGGGSQQNPLLHQQLANLGHPNNLDMRNPNLAQGLNVNSGPRGFNQPVSAGHPSLGMRQQQHQQSLPPHIVSQLGPQVHQQGPPLPSNQAQDLMALLMGGPHRE